MSDNPSSRQPGLSRSDHVVPAQGRRLVSHLLELIEDPRRFLDEFPVLITQIDKHAEDTATALVEAMGDPQLKGRFLAAWFIVQLGAKRPDLFDRRADIQEAAEVLVSGLNGDFEAQLWSCVLLGQGAPIPAAVERLSELVEHPDERIQVLAAAALSKTDAGNATLIQTLRRGLHSDNPVLAAAAAGAFAALGVHSPKPLEEIGSALERAGEDCQYFILNAIGALGPTSTPLAAVLIRFLEDSARHPTLRGHAAAILARVTKGTDTAAAPLSAALAAEDDPELVRGIVDGLIELRHFPADVVERLVQLLSASDEELRIIAATGLASVGPYPEHVLPHLIARIGLEPNPRMVEALARAIGAGRQAAVAPLVAVIKEHDIRKLPVVSASFIAMGHEGAALLAAGIPNESDEWTRYVLTNIVREMGPSAAPAVPTFATLLDEADDEEWAAYLLMTIFVTGPAAMQALPAVIRRIENGSEELSEWAEQVIRRIGPRAAGPLETALAAAEGTAAHRLRRVLANLRPSDDGRFRSLEAIDDDALLQRFVYIAEILLERGPTSYAQMEKILEERKIARAIERGCSTSASYLRLAVQELERMWNVRLTERMDGKKGGPTDELRCRLPEVRAYLQARADRRAATENS